MKNKPGERKKINLYIYGKQQVDGDERMTQQDSLLVGYQERGSKKKEAENEEMQEIKTAKEKENQVKEKK